MENDELTQYLAALEREGRYRVDATLKEAPHEVTQRVFLSCDNGCEQGPFIRKLIDRDSGMGHAYLRIFEAQQAGRHFAHVPEIRECYYNERCLVVVMQFVRGETLQDVVYRRDPSLPLAREVFPLACDAVTELHESFDPPLIHRDLKPSNVMYSEEGLTIIDFGIAREYKDGAEADTVKFGTRAFAPPEQFGFGQTTVQSDVYALGMLLYYCLTEKIPSKEARDAGFMVEGVPESMVPVLQRATALDAAQRFASASELKSAFLDAADTSNASNHVQSAVAGPAAESKQGRKRMAVVVSSVAAVAAVCAAMAVGVLAGTTGGDTASQAATQQSMSTVVSSTASASTASASTASQVGAESTQSDSANGQATASSADTSVETVSAQMTAPPRNGFDPTTNRQVQVAGVTFQIPAYFGEPTTAGDTSGDNAAFYYAETGSSTALIMTSEFPLDPVEGEEGNARDPQEVLDGYLSGLLGSESAFQTITSSTDLTLAGYSARIVDFTGTVSNLPMNTRASYFYNADVNSIGSVLFGQTSNAQFDYSADFAKVIASAAR